MLSTNMISNEKRCQNLIESAQRAFTKRFSGFQNIYADRLVKLKLQSLEHRCLVYALTLCFNIVHGIPALTFPDFFQFTSVHVTVQIYEGILCASQSPCKENVRKHNFAVRDLGSSQLSPISHRFRHIPLRDPNLSLVSIVTPSTTSIFKILIV